MPIARFQMPDGRVARFEVPEGTTPEQAQGMMKDYFTGQQDQPVATETPAPAQPERPGILDQLKRQAGLTGRYAIEGLGDVAKIIYDPFAAGLNYIPGVNLSAANPSGIPDMLGLPKPETPTEKIVGTASRTLASAAPFLKAGQLASTLEGPTKAAVGRLMSTQPMTQAASASMAGATGETAKQKGAGPTGQFFASLGGGLSPAMITSFGTKATEIAKNLSRGKVSNDLVDALLQRNKIDIGNMQQSAKNALRNDVRSVLKQGGTVDQTVLNRLADYRQVGATPTRGTVTLDPAIVTMEKNLAKIGVNTGDEALQRLAQIQNDNDQVLIQTINRIGAENADDPVKAGASIMEALRKADEPRKKAVDMAYQAVRDSQGRYAKLNNVAFVDMANTSLDEKMLGSALPAGAKNLLNDIAEGKIPLNVNTMVQIDKRLSGQARDAMASGNSEASLAIKQVRDALQNTPIDSGAGQNALDLYNRARGLAAQRFSIIDQTPALKAALDDVAPDKFVKNFIISSGPKANQRDVAALAEQLADNPQAMEQAKTQILAYLKDKALSGAPDEMGKFSPAGFRRALNSIGRTKLGMFFTKQEMNEIDSLARVAGYEKFRPTGAAVNESNTAATLIGRGLDALAQGASKVPFGGQVITEPYRSIMQGRQAQQATDLTQALMRRQQQAMTTLPQRLTMPAIYGSGLVSGRNQ